MLAGPLTDGGDEDLDDSSVRALTAATPPARELWLSQQAPAPPFDAADSGATRPPAVGVCGDAAAGFLEKMGLECTTCRPAIHFSASFHLDGTCRKNGPETATAAAGGGCRAVLSSL